MRAQLWRIGLALVAALTLNVTPGLAQGHGHGSGRHSNGGTVAFRHDFDRHEHGRVIFRDDRRDDRSFFHPRLSTDRPPGWDHGRKVGWGDCDVPPGQAKKMGCRNGFIVDRHPHRGHVIIFP